MYLVLDDGPPGFPQGFSSPVVLGILLGCSKDFDYAAITLYGRPFQTFHLSLNNPTLQSRNPDKTYVLSV